MEPFMSQKYCKKLNAMVLPWRNGSHVWRKRLECRELVEHQILWQIRMGSSLFWIDNWAGLGALYFITPPHFYCDEEVRNMRDVIHKDGWEVDKIMEILPEELALHILENINPPEQCEKLDISYWMLETRGDFSVKSALEYLRRRDDPSIIYKNMWVKGLPFKIFFFLWKVWKGKLELDDTLR
ncbi:uncharacterized protein [Nicotiana tomentosiformis]|uniref:uncharacterized protein n=1 Tax=Nicotiana tomentosiformis TaxID=4098 RepID=UPI00388C4A9D